MAKINTTDLKGFKLCLLAPTVQVPKDAVQLGTLDAVEPTNADGKVEEKWKKAEMLLHFSRGNQFAGESVADLPDSRVLVFKGSLLSRRAAVPSSTNSVGKGA